MPAGEIGTVWAEDSWPDTAWEAGSWAEAQEAITLPDILDSSTTCDVPARITSCGVPSRTTERVQV